MAAAAYEHATRVETPIENAVVRSAYLLQCGAHRPRDVQFQSLALPKEGAKNIRKGPVRKVDREKSTPIFTCGTWHNPRAWQGSRAARADSSAAANMASGKTPAAGKLGLKRFYERTESIEPFYTGGPIALARSGAIVACGCGGNVKIVDVQTGAVLQNIKADGEQVTAIALSPNEQELVTSGRDFLVKTWDVASGAHARMWKSGQGTSYVQRLCYDETGTLVAGGCSDFVVRVWDAGRGYATHNLKGHGSIVTSVCFGATPQTDPNKLLLFSGTDEGEVRATFTFLAISCCPIEFFEANQLNSCPDHRF